MRMQLSDSDALLKQALDDLNRRFEATAASWRDSSRADFEKEHLDELRRMNKAAERGMAELQALLRQVIRECS